MNESPNLDALLVRTFNTYRRGLRRQPELRLEMPPRNFDVLIFLGTIGWFPKEARLQLRTLLSECNSGLRAARKGLLDDSSAYYEEAREYLDSMRAASPLAYLLGASIHEAGVAYLHFRHGRVEQAHQCLDRAMDADLELERAGLPIMVMHRIQQGHNLARMSLRVGPRQEGVELAGKLLAFMEKQLDELPYHDGWDSGALRAVSRDQLRAMIHQIIGETAMFIVKGENRTEEWRALIEGARLLESPDSAVFPQVQYALRAQSALSKGNHEEYLQTLEKFFQPGIRDCFMLWYSLMVELVDFCRRANTETASRALEIILQDSTKWRAFPSALNDLFDPSEIHSQVA